MRVQTEGPCTLGTFGWVKTHRGAVGRGELCHQEQWSEGRVCSHHSDGQALTILLMAENFQQGADPLDTLGGSELPGIAGIQAELRGEDF